VIVVKANPFESKEVKGKIKLIPKETAASSVNETGSPKALATGVSNADITKVCAVKERSFKIFMVLVLEVLKKRGLFTD
jgi:hypothetical protein